MILTFLIGVLPLSKAYAQDIDDLPSKTVLVDSKYKDGLYQYKLGCTTFFDENLRPQDCVFVFMAQNEKYEVLKDLFSICSGNAIEVFETLSMILEFSENFKEDGIEMPKNGFSLKNYKIPMFGWYTLIDTNKGWHNFKTKDFKRIIKKMEEYCKKNNIPYLKE